MPPPRDNDEFAQPRGSLLPWGQFTDCSGRGRQNTDTRAVCRLFQHSRAGARELDKLLPDRTLSRKLPLLGAGPHKLRCYRTNCRQFAVCDTTIWIWRSQSGNCPDMPLHYANCLAVYRLQFAHVFREQFTDNFQPSSILLPVCGKGAVYCCQSVQVSLCTKCQFVNKMPVCKAISLLGEKCKHH